MKKLSASMGIGSLSLLFAGAVFAQTYPAVPPAPGITAPPAQVQVKERVNAVDGTSNVRTPADARALSETRKPDTRPLQKDKRDNIARRAEGLVVSSMRIIERTEKHIARVNDLTARFEAKGANVDEAKKHTGLAVAKIAEAKIKLEEIKTSIKDIPTATNPRDAIKAAQDKIKEFRAVIKESHHHITNAISSLRNAAGLRDKATTTPARNTDASSVQ